MSKLLKYKSLIENIDILSYAIKVNLRNGILFMMTLGFFMCGVFTAILFQDFFQKNIGFTIFVSTVFGFIILYSIIVIYNNVCIEKRNYKALDLFREQVLTLRYETWQIDNIDDILRKNELISDSYVILIGMEKFIKKNFSKIAYFKYEELMQEIGIFFNQILIDLCSDLSLRLTEQKQTLESAKSEVESNINGTTELEQVSELQRARLDKQIEQFEELQRVLMKV